MSTISVNIVKGTVYRLYVWVDSQNWPIYIFSILSLNVISPSLDSSLRTHIRGIGSSSLTDPDPDPDHLPKLDLSGYLQIYSRSRSFLSKYHHKINLNPTYSSSQNRFRLVWIQISIETELVPDPDPFFLNTIARSIFSLRTHLRRIVLSSDVDLDPVLFASLIQISFRGLLDLYKAC